MLGRRAFGTGAAAAALTFSRGRLAAAQASSKVLRVVPQAEPQSFDPVFTQVNNVSMHGAMIYDQLFGWDDMMNVQPQMVDDWKTTDDRLLYTFTLRRGLKFHDGGDVTTRDVVASLKRMFVRDGQNQLLAGLIDEYQRIDDRSFSIRLKAPFAFTEFLLGGSNGVVGAIMREKDAMTDPFTQVKERIGSGPFRFIDAEYRPGAKLVYEKFDGYVPRSEPASGFAGGKVVKVDRVEWVIIPDTSVAFNALRSGEVGAEFGEGAVNCEADIAIVGYGPAGATLANLLGQSGISTLVLEREETAYHLPRAVHLDDEVMRVFDTIGLAAAIEPTVHVSPGMRFMDAAGRGLLEWPRPKERTPQGWHASYRFHQPELECILAEDCRGSLGIRAHADRGTGCRSGYRWRRRPVREPADRSTGENSCSLCRRMRRRALVHPSQDRRDAGRHGLQ